MAYERFQFKEHFCDRPFAVAQIHADGTLHFCPMLWQKLDVGDLRRGSFDEAWNSPVAQSVRRSIHDGTFLYCSKARCPYLCDGGAGLTQRDAITDPMLRTFIETAALSLSVGPRHVELGYADTPGMPAVQERIANDALFDARTVSIALNQEPLTSPLYLRLLREFPWEAYVSLGIELVTDGKALDAAMWNTLQRAHKAIRSIQVHLGRFPIHCCHAFTPRADRALIANLRFVSGLRSGRQLEHIALRFDVTSENFSQMRAIAWFAQRHRFDMLHFQLPQDDPGAKPGPHSVHHELHPKHRAFLRILRDPALWGENVHIDPFPSHAEARAAALRPRAVRGLFRFLPALRLPYGGHTR